MNLVGQRNGCEVMKCKHKWVLIQSKTDLADAGELLSAWVCSKCGKWKEMIGENER